MVSGMTLVEAIQAARAEIAERDDGNDRERLLREMDALALHPDFRGISISDYHVFGPGEMEGGLTHYWWGAVFCMEQDNVVYRIGVYSRDGGLIGAVTAIAKGSIYMQGMDAHGQELARNIVSTLRHLERVSERDIPAASETRLA